MSTTVLDVDKKVTAVGPSASVSVVVKQKCLLAERVIGLTLESHEDVALPSWEPGAHIDLILPGGVVRQYSLYGNRKNPRQYQIGILLEPDGAASTFIDKGVKEGDTICIGRPRNHFGLAPFHRYILIAGGVGITPFLPMLESFEAQHKPWTLYYAGRSQSSMAFFDYLSKFKDKVVFAPKTAGQRLDLKSILGTAQPDTAVYCCGPSRMIETVSDLCLGVWSKGAIYLERFTPIERKTDENRPFKIRLERSNLTLDVPADRSAIDVIADAGVFIPCSCKEGTCGSCEVDVLEGVPDHRDSVLTEEERDSNSCMMVCISRSKTPLLIIDV